ncbi:unnamed protein product [Darwinula stevensoni]|uniref:BRCT domain-containing protein n=1 Tax=Darwinula stevensoni TaxID=69355 RepID=A0A7R8XC43_9CRUS|nr:unnamed protein product [Darwinula stevensoni]CAG0887124.1 unnamed protein product [Darwinula stevensoni]
MGSFQSIFWGAKGAGEANNGLNEPNSKQSPEVKKIKRKHESEAPKTSAPRAPARAPSSSSRLSLGFQPMPAKVPRYDEGISMPPIHLHLEIVQSSPQHLHSPQLQVTSVQTNPLRLCDSAAQTLISSGFADESFEDIMKEKEKERKIGGDTEMEENLEKQDHIKTPSPSQGQVKQVLIYAILQSAPSRVKEKIVLLCSALTEKDQQMVEKFARLIGAGIVQSFNPQVTHLIVYQNMKVTMKFLYGICHRKWIVDFSWVQKSLNAKMCLPEDDFEATYANHEMGPHRARTGSPPPFENVQVACLEPLRNISRQIMEEMITLCGGLVVSSPDHFVPGRKIAVILGVNSVDVDYEALAVEYPHALILDQRWAVRTIGSYNIVPIEDYVISLRLSDRLAVMDLDLPKGYLKSSHGKNSFH